jgi:hypothetical protein
MKRTNLEIVRCLLGENINKSNSRKIIHGDENVNFERKTSKRYRQYF